MSTRIIAVRHGYSVSNEQKFFAGQLDVALTDKGISQAEACGELFCRAYGENDTLTVENTRFERPSAIYASDLVRAYRTAQPIARALGLDVISTKGLREVSAGEWEGVPFIELDERYAEEYGVWKNDIGRATCTGGERLSNFAARIERAVREIAERHDGECVVIVTHATPIRVLCTLASGLDPADMGRVGWVSNASVSFFEFDGGFHLVRANGTEHLRQMKTDLPRGV